MPPPGTALPGNGAALPGIGAAVPGNGAAGKGAAAGEKPKQVPSPRRARARRRAAKRVRAANRSRQPDAATGAGAASQAGPGDPARVVRVGSPASLLALVPQLLGFEPRNSIVLVGAMPPRGRVRLTLRFDLPTTPDLAIADELARHAMGVLVAQGFETGVVVGYGPGRLVTPVADAVRRHAAGLGFRLTDVLRAEGKRYWSYVCSEPSCCSPDGEPYDVPGHSVTAAFAAAGAPPVLASREELAASVATLDGPAGEAMLMATRLAEDRSGQLVAGAAASGRTGAVRRAIASAGLEAVRGAIEAYRAGGEFRSDARRRLAVGCASRPARPG